MSQRSPQPTFDRKVVAYEKWQEDMQDDETRFVASVLRDYFRKDRERKIRNKELARKIAKMRGYEEPDGIEPAW